MSDELQDEAVRLAEALRKTNYTVPEALVVVGMVATALICCSPTPVGREHVLKGFVRTLTKTVRERGL